MPLTQRPPARRLTTRLLAGTVLAALGGGVLSAAPVAGAAAAAPAGHEPGVTMRVYHVPYDLDELCTLKPAQTPNVDLLRPTVNWTTTTDFGDAARQDRFVTHVTASLEVPVAGDHTFELRSDDGSKLWIDDQVVVDNDGLPAVDVPKTGTVTLSAGSHDLFVEHFERRGGQRLTLSWRKPGDAAFSIIPASALSTPTEVTRVTAPGNKECEGAQDAPGDGLQLDSVNPAYTLVDLRPTGFNPKVTGLAWQGEDLLVLTWGASGDGATQNNEGRLYRLAGAKSADGPEDVVLTELYGGLREPQGLVLADVDGDGVQEYYVSEKHQLSRLENTDGDPQLDVKEMLWQVPTSNNFHEFAFGLLHRDGKFWLNTSVSINRGGATTDPQLAPSLPDGTQTRGNTVAIDDTTGEMEIVAGGLRTPNGIGVGPEEGLFVTDNQGAWLPASKLVHVKPGRFFEHRTNPAGPFQDQAATKPVLWMPQNEIANSPSTPVSIPSGPFAGQMLIGDVTYGGLQRAFLEKVGGEYQGALFRGTQGLEAGINEVLMDDSGTVVVGGIGGGGNWQQSGKLQYGLQKLVPSGVTPFEMKSMEVVEGGFEITYTHPVGAETLADLASKYVVKQWAYRPTAQYGGPKIGEETLRVTSATASQDGRTVALAIDGLRPDRVVHLRSPRPFSSATGETLYNTEAWYTLNVLPGYVEPEPTPAPGGLYEAEDQEVLGGARVQTEHAGFTGSGYVGGFASVGDGVRSDVVVEEAGTYDLDVRYSNGPNPAGIESKQMSLVIDGATQKIVLPSTNTWQTYQTFRHTVTLREGVNVVDFVHATGDRGHVNLDHLRFTASTGVRHELETGVLTGGAEARTEHAGYSGTGFVAGYRSVGASAAVTVHAQEAGPHPVRLGYANGPNPVPDQTKRMTVEVNGAAQQISLPPTGAWASWSTWSGELTLRPGANTVAFRYGAADDGNVNLDYLDVQGLDPVSCEPGVDPDDTFEGDALDRCRWTTILNEDPSGYRVADGKLEIDARPGDLSSTNTSAKNIILQPVRRTGPWMVESAVSVDGTDDYLQAGLAVWGNNRNYGKVTVMRHPTNGWVVLLGRVTGGSLQSATVPLAAGQQTDVRLRMWSEGGFLRGSFSVDDGTTWTEIGHGYGVNGLADVLVGPSAYNGNGTETATFDDFTIAAPPPEAETCEAAAPEAGYTMLFDGTRASMAGWRMADGGAFVRWSDCSVKSVGASGLWWHTTPIDHAYSLRMDWMMPGDDNSGVFVGFPDPGGNSRLPITQGHEVQIDPTDDPDSTTGAIYNFAAPDAAARDAALKPVGEWNAYEIVVEGDRIRVYLNGVLINDFTDTDPQRMNLPSHIGLQTHGNSDDVYFRNVQIKDLDAPAPVDSTLEVTAEPGTIDVGETATVTVDVTAEGTTPTGEVTLTDDGQPVGDAVTLVDGRATFQVGPYAAAGTRALAASYAGSETVTASDGTATLVVVDPAPVASSTTATASPSTVRVGRSTEVDVVVAAEGVTPTGRVTVRDGSRVLGAGMLVDGTATVEAGPFTAAGNRTLTVAYAGDDAVSASSTTVAVVVRAKPRPKPVLKVRPPVVDATKSRRAGLVRVTCAPAGVRCMGTATLRSGGKVLGSGRVSVAGGRTVTLRLTLTKRARAVLAARPRARGTLVVVLDRAGRSGTRVTLRR